MLLAATALPLLFSWPALADPAGGFGLVDGYVLPGTGGLVNYVPVPGPAPDRYIPVYNAPPGTGSMKPNNVAALSGDGRTLIGNTFDEFNWATRSWMWTLDGGTVALDAFSLDFENGTLANAINYDGSIIAGHSTEYGGKLPVLWRNGTIERLSLGDDMFSVGGSATAISDDGSVVAGFQHYGSGTYFPAAWIDGVFLRITSSDGDPWIEGMATGVSGDGNYVIGWNVVEGDFWSGYTQGKIHSFRWDALNGAVDLLPFGMDGNVLAKDIDEDGSVVVGMAKLPTWNLDSAFRWTAQGNAITSLGGLPGYTRSMAKGVSADGSAVVGISYDNASSWGFYWTPLGGMVSIEDWLRGLGVTIDGHVVASADSISADGTVVAGLNLQGNPYIARGTGAGTGGTGGTTGTGTGTSTPNNGGGSGATGGTSDPGTGTTDPNSGGGGGTGGTTDPGTGTTDPSDGNGGTGGTTDPGTGTSDPSDGSGGTGGTGDPGTGTTDPNGGSGGTGGATDPGTGTTDPSDGSGGTGGTSGPGTGTTDPNGGSGGTGGSTDPGTGTTDPSDDNGGTGGATDTGTGTTDPSDGNVGTGGTGDPGTVTTDPNNGNGGTGGTSDPGTGTTDPNGGSGGTGGTTDPGTGTSDPSDGSGGTGGATDPGSGTTDPNNGSGGTSGASDPGTGTTDPNGGSGGTGGSTDPGTGTTDPSDGSGGTGGATDPGSGTTDPNNGSGATGGTSDPGTGTTDPNNGSGGTGGATDPGTGTTDPNNGSGGTGATTEPGTSTTDPNDGSGGTSGATDPGTGTTDPSDGSGGTGGATDPGTGTTDPNGGSGGTGGTSDPGTGTTDPNGGSGGTGDATDPGTGTTDPNNSSDGTGGTTDPGTDTGGSGDPGTGGNGNGVDPEPADPDSTGGSTGGAYEPDPDGDGGYGYGIIDLVQYNWTIQAKLSTLMLVRGMDMAVHGAHGSPMQIMPQAGKFMSWVAGDFGREESDASSGGLQAGEVGLAYGFGEGLVGRMALGRNFDDQQLEPGGRAVLRGTYVMPEVTFDIGGIKTTLSGYYNRGSLEVERGYINGTAMDYSSGETDGVTYAGRVRFDWLDAFRLGGTGFTPYGSYTSSVSRLDGYTEKDGSFPARFDAQTERFNVVRLGLDARHELGEGLALLGRIEGSYRFEAAAPDTTGEILGIGGFAVPGHGLNRTWGRVGAGVEFTTGAGTGMLMINATSEGSDPDVWLASSWRVTF